MRTVYAFAITLLLPNCSLSDEKTSNEELKKLQGLWEVKETYWCGEKLPRKEQSHTHWEFKEDKLFITLRPLQAGEKGTVMEFSYSVDPGKGFSLIDLPTKHPKLGFIGIYKLDNDELKVCIRAGRESRPATFDTDQPDKFKLILKKTNQSHP